MHSTTTSPSSLDGDYDLYSEYMYGPICLCDQTPEETSVLTHCVPTAPWTDVVLPAGY